MNRLRWILARGLRVVRGWFEKPELDDLDLEFLGTVILAQDTMLVLRRWRNEEAVE